MKRERGKGFPSPSIEERKKSAHGERWRPQTTQELVALGRERKRDSTSSFFWGKGRGNTGPQALDAAVEEEIKTLAQRKEEGGEKTLPSNLSQKKKGDERP